jgi:hypothetical protein
MDFLSIHLFLGVPTFLLSVLIFSYINFGMRVLFIHNAWCVFLRLQTTMISFTVNGFSSSIILFLMGCLVIHNIYSESDLSNFVFFFTLFFHAVFIEIQIPDRCRIVGTTIIYFQICSFIIYFKCASNCSTYINCWRVSDLYYSIICIRQTTLQTVTLFCLYNYFAVNNSFLPNMFISVKLKIFILTVEILKLWPIYI